MCEIKNSSFSANVSEVLIFARCENLLACVSIFGKNVFTGKLTLVNNRSLIKTLIRGMQRQTQDMNIYKHLQTTKPTV